MNAEKVKLEDFDFLFHPKLDCKDLCMTLQKEHEIFGNSDLVLSFRIPVNRYPNQHFFSWVFVEIMNVMNIIRHFRLKEATMTAVCFASRTIVLKTLKRSKKDHRPDCLTITEIEVKEKQFDRLSIWLASFLNRYSAHGPEQWTNVDMEERLLATAIEFLCKRLYGKKIPPNIPIISEFEEHQTQIEGDDIRIPEWTIQSLT